MLASTTELRIAVYVTSIVGFHSELHSWLSVYPLDIIGITVDSCHSREETQYPWGPVIRFMDRHYLPAAVRVQRPAFLGRRIYHWPQAEATG